MVVLREIGDGLRRGIALVFADGDRRGVAELVLLSLPAVQASFG
jgi:hypothetical protein